MHRLCHILKRLKHACHFLERAKGTKQKFQNVRQIFCHFSLLNLAIKLARMNGLQFVVHIIHHKPTGAAL